jgi:hypothetical protein
MKERWIEWKVEASWTGRNHEHAIVAIYDGPSGAQIGRANVAIVGKRMHVILQMLNNLLNQHYAIELEEGEELSPLHFEPLVGDIEKVLPGLSGDVITAIFQAINTVKTLNARRRSER